MATNFLTACLRVGRLGLCLAPISFISLAAFAQTAKKAHAHKPRLQPMNLPKPPQLLSLLKAEELRPDSANPLIYRDKEGVLDGRCRIIYSEDYHSDGLVVTTPFFFAEGQLTNGLKQGIWQVNFLLAITGLNYRESYKDGLLDGDFIVYRPDKSICYRTTFQHGTGTWKSFYPSGKPRLVYSLVRGQLQGTRTEYAPDGSVESEAVYDHGAIRSNKTP